jgi:hypothetical protein
LQSCREEKFAEQIHNSNGRVIYYRIKEENTTELQSLQNNKGCKAAGLYRVSEGTELHRLQSGRDAE